MVKKTRSASSKNMSRSQARSLVRKLLGTSAYLRWRSLDKQTKLSSSRYKKGYEFRFPVKTVSASRELKQALALLGIKSGKPFKKGLQTIVPVYGYEQVEKLIEMSEHWELV